MQCMNVCVCIHIAIVLGKPMRNASLRKFASYQWFVFRYAPFYIFTIVDKYLIVMAQADTIANVYSTTTPEITAK